MIGALLGHRNQTTTSRYAHLADDPVRSAADVVATLRLAVARQRKLGRDGGVVLDGRDIGSAVFPDAELKFYVDADPVRRAERRQPFD